MVLVEPFVTFPIWEQRRFVVAKATCAVLMPFDDERLEALWDDIVTPAIRAAEFEPVRADRSVQPKVVEYIWTLLNESHVVVADVSGANPNVLYELGIAHTLGKPTILLRSDPAPAVPFDIRHLRSIKYVHSPDGEPELRAELEEALRALARTHPYGHHLLDELEFAVRRWRGPSREFDLLYDPSRLSMVEQYLPPDGLSDYALAFCAASACQWGSAGPMVRWGTLCNARPVAAVDLGFGLFNHQRRPKLRIAHLLSHFDEAVRNQVVASLAEHGLGGEILEAIRSGRVDRYVADHREALGLNIGEFQELTDLLNNSRIVVSRRLP